MRIAENIPDLVIIRKIKADTSRDVLAQVHLYLRDAIMNRALVFVAVAVTSALVIAAGLPAQNSSRSASSQGDIQRTALESEST